MKSNRGNLEEGFDKELSSSFKFWMFCLPVELKNQYHTS